MSTLVAAPRSQAVQKWRGSKTPVGRQLAERLVAGLERRVGGGLGDLVGGRLGEDVEVIVIDRERRGVGADQADLLGVDLAVGERHHREHPDRAVGFLRGLGRRRQPLRVDRGDRVEPGRCRPRSCRERDRRIGRRASA
jgi:hypothetical protein